MLASNAKKREYSLSEYNFLLNFPENECKRAQLEYRKKMTSGLHLYVLTWF